MNKAAAVIAMMLEERNPHITTAGARRMLTALRALGVDDRNDIIRVLHHLVFCDEHGNPYDSKVKRVWP